MEIQRELANLNVFDNSNNLAFSAKNLRANIDVKDSGNKKEGYCNLKESISISSPVSAQYSS
ncbi:MAG: hypothetical protein ACJ0PT_02055 [Flavobacteriales bacterium]